MTVSAPAQKGVDVESGPAPAHPLTEPGRTTVQLLVASSAVLALLQLVAATSVDVYNGGRAGWWVAIQGATVAFAAAFAGAAAGANGAWWRRMQQKTSSTTAASLGTAAAAAGVAGAVFAVLCWASNSLGNATYPMSLAVLVAAILGGVVGGARAGGAVLGGLVSTFVATLVNLTGQAFTTMFVLAPAVADGTISRGTPLPVSAATWLVSAVTGTLAGVWWLSRRRQHTTVVHCLIVSLYPVVLVLIGDLSELLAWLVVSDPAKGDALREAVPSHAVQLGVLFAGGLITALVAGRALRTRRAWPVRPSWLNRAPATAEQSIPGPVPSTTPTAGPYPQDQPTVPLAQLGTLPPSDVAPEWRPTTGTAVPPPAGAGPTMLNGNGSHPTPGTQGGPAGATTPSIRPVTTVRRGNGVVRGGLTRLIPTQRRDEASKS